jgi:hypothetical protein
MRASVIARMMGLSACNYEHCKRINKFLRIKNCQFLLLYFQLFTPVACLRLDLQIPAGSKRVSNTSSKIRLRNSTDLIVLFPCSERTSPGSDGIEGDFAVCSTMDVEVLTGHK